MPSPLSHIVKTLRSRVFLLAAGIAVAGCAGTAVTRESFMRIPEHPMRPNQDPGVRGTAREAGRISPDQQFEILGEVVRRFYRPMMQQARWIDPQPLANQRTRLADSL